MTPSTGQEKSDPFRTAMRELAGHVVMVTTSVEDRPWGMTVSAFCSLSADPPLVLVSLGSHTKSLDHALATGMFGVSILTAAHKPLASFGARPNQPKYIDTFSEIRFTDRGDDRSPSSASPMVADALHHLDCSVAKSFEVEDHTLLVGRVEQVVEGSRRPGPLSGPLLYYDRDFRHLGSLIT